jgi:hypothetical protein
LGFDKLLVLSQEVLALGVDKDTLHQGLTTTIESIRAGGKNQVLKNHNYLKKVLGGITETQVETRKPRPTPERRAEDAPGYDPRRDKSKQAAMPDNVKQVFSKILGAKHQQTDEQRAAAVEENRRRTEAFLQQQMGDTHE